MKGLLGLILLIKGSESMNFNNKDQPRIYVSGCSFLGCILAFVLFNFIIQGSLYLVFEYFWLFLVLGVVVFVFRRLFKSKKGNRANTEEEKKKTDWHRDFENRDSTSYHNFEREFEEVDEEDIEE